MRSVTVRPATTADASLLHEWRSEAVVRSNSRNTREIDPGSHAAWLQASIADPSRLLLIGLSEGGQPIGTVRFDAIADHPGTWEASITLGPEWRGRGLAVPLLLAGEGALRARADARTVVAEVRASNEASLRLFTAVGYVILPGDGGTWLRLEKHLDAPVASLHDAE